MIPYGVIYAPEAIDQVEALFAYIAERKSPAVADRYTSAVLSTCEGLALFPMRGVLREDSTNGIHTRGALWRSGP